MKNRICPICRSPAIDLRYKCNIDSSLMEPYLISADLSGRSHDLFQCRNCQHVFVDDQDFINAVISCYADQPVDDTYLSEAAGRLKTADKYLQRLETLLGHKSSLVDIGCYNGFFLSAAAKRGWNVFGVENSASAVKLAREKFDLQNIINDTIEEAVVQLDDQGFDVITMFDVIEHLLDPSDIVGRICEKIKPGGLLLISTPDITSLMSRIQKQKWYAVLPSHIHLFSRQSLFTLLKDQGLQLVHVSYLTRYFSLGYMFSRSHLSKQLKLDRIINRSFLSSWLFPYNARDQLVVIAEK